MTENCLLLLEDVGFSCVVKILSVKGGEPVKLPSFLPWPQ